MIPRISETIIRPAVADDLADVISIYNVSARKKFLTGDVEPWNLVDKIEWFWSHLNEQEPIYVLVLKDKIVGWICVNSYRPGRGAMRFTKEISYYVSHDHLGQGFGSLLLQYLLSKAEQLKMKTIIAIMLDTNTRSINLLKKFGFKEWGYLPCIADFDGTNCGHYYYGLTFCKV